MKKILAILSATALVFAVTSCATTKKAEAAPAAAEAPAAPAYVEPTLPTGEMTILDNFADGNYWEAVGSGWDDEAQNHHNMVSICDLSEDKFAGWPTAGASVSLKCESSEPESGNTGCAFWMCNNVAVTDWTGMNYLAVDVYNANDFEIKLDLCLQTTDANDTWIWAQAPEVSVPKGAHTVLYSFKDLIKAENGYKDAAYMAENFLNIKRVNFANFCSESNTFYLGNMRLYK